MMLNIRPSDNVYSQNIASESLTDYHEARAPPNGQSPFQQLVEELATVLEPCSGLSFHDVDPSTIIRAMEKYESNRREWHKYAFEDFSRAYTRNLVHRGNGKSNLLLLVWSPGRKSPIHDHANSHCVMKILRGRLVETRFTPSEPNTVSVAGHAHDADAHPLHVKQVSTFHTNDVAYMCDDLGLHSISNPDPHEPAVSLHLYTPPNAEKFGCHIFDPETGAKTKTSGCLFYSVDGRRC